MTPFIFSPQLHLAFRNNSSEVIMNELMRSFPNAVYYKDEKGRLPIHLFTSKTVVDKSDDAINFMRLYFTTELKQRNYEREEFIRSSEAMVKKIAILEEELSKAKEQDQHDQRDNNADCFDDLFQKIEQYESRSVQHEAEKIRNKKAIDELTQLVERQQLLLSEHEEEKQDMYALIRKKEGIIFDLRKKIESNETVHTFSEDEREEMQAKLNEMTTKNEAEKQQVKKLLDNNQQLSFALRESKEAQEELTRESILLKTDNNKLKSRIAELESQIITAQENSQQNVKDVEEMMAVIADLQHAKIKNDFTSQENVGSLENNSSNSLGAHADNTYKIPYEKNIREEEVISLQSELTALKQQIENQNQEVDDDKESLQLKLKATEDELFAAFQTSIELGEKVKEFQVRETEMMEKIKKLEDADIYNLNMINELNSSNHDLLDEKICLTRKIKSLSEELSTITPSFDETQTTKTDVEKIVSEKYANIVNYFEKMDLHYSVQEHHNDLEDVKRRRAGLTSRNHSSHYEEKEEVNRKANTFERASLSKRVGDRVDRFSNGMNEFELVHVKRDTTVNHGSNNIICRTGGSSTPSGKDQLLQQLEALEKAVKGP